MTISKSKHANQSASDNKAKDSVRSSKNIKKLQSGEPVSCNKAVVYNQAVDQIKCAMSTLGDLAKQNDEMAKEAIVNMSVVAFDLTSAIQ